MEGCRGLHICHLLCPCCVFLMIVEGCVSLWEVTRGNLSSSPHSLWTVQESLGGTWEGQENSSCGLGEAGASLYGAARTASVSFLGQLHCLHLHRSMILAEALMRGDEDGKFLMPDLFSKRSDCNLSGRFSLLLLRVMCFLLLGRCTNNCRHITVL